MRICSDIRVASHKSWVAVAAQVEEGADADDDGDEGTCCGGEAHREQGHGVPDGCQVDERDARRHDGDDVVQERKL